MSFCLISNRHSSGGVYLGKTIFAGELGITAPEKKNTRRVFAKREGRRRIQWNK
jgi:hypothetical protein